MADTYPPYLSVAVEAEAHLEAVPLVVLLEAAPSEAVEAADVFNSFLNNISQIGLIKEIFPQGNFPKIFFNRKKITLNTV